MVAREEKRGMDVDDGAERGMGRLRFWRERREVEVEETLIVGTE